VGLSPGTPAISNPGFIAPAADNSDLASPDTSLQEAYQREFAFLAGLKRQLEQRLGRVEATNRNDQASLAAEIDGLESRLLSSDDRVESLREQLADDPEDLYNLVLFICRRIVEHEADPLAVEVTGWIEENLGRDYPWPGNFRELEQCVRNVLIRRTYRPHVTNAVAAGGSGDLAATHYKDPAILADVSRGLGDAMQSIETSKLAEADQLSTRGW